MARKDADPKLTNSTINNLRHKTALSAGKVLKRNISHVLGENDNLTGEPVVMTPAQVASSKLVLDKCMPSLQAQELTTKSNEPKRTKLELMTALLNELAKNPAEIQNIINTNPALARALQGIATKPLEAIKENKANDSTGNL